MKLQQLKRLLVFLISSITITGLSLLDGKIWDIFFIIIGIAAYAIVGLLFSIGLLNGKKAGKDAYAFIFILLVLGAYAVYKGLVAFKEWVLMWPLFAKIIVPSAIGLCIIITVVLIVLTKKGIIFKKNKNEEVGAC